VDIKRLETEAVLAAAAVEMVRLVAVVALVDKEIMGEQTLVLAEMLEAVEAAQALLAETHREALVEMVGMARRALYLGPQLHTLAAVAAADERQEGVEDQEVVVAVLLVTTTEPQEPQTLAAAAAAAVQTLEWVAAAEETVEAESS
jgi:hypothetical protein